MYFDNYIVFDDVWSYAIYDWWIDAFFILYWCIFYYALHALNDIEMGRNTYTSRFLSIWDFLSILAIMEIG